MPDFGRPLSTKLFLDFICEFDDFEFAGFCNVGRQCQFDMRSTILEPFLQKLAGESDTEGEEPIAGMLYFYLGAKKNARIKKQLLEKLSADTKPAKPVADADKLKEKLGTAFRNSTLVEDRRNFLQFVTEHSRNTLVARYKFTGLGKELLKTVRASVNEPGYEFGPFEKVDPEWCQRTHF